MLARTDLYKSLFRRVEKYQFILQYFQAKTLNSFYLNSFRNSEHFLFIFDRQVALQPSILALSGFGFRNYFIKPLNTSQLTLFEESDRCLMW